jgi:hypothetical protein
VLATVLFLEMMIEIGSLGRPVAATTDIAVLSHTGYVDAFGYYHVVGELLNTGEGVADFVIVYVTFYDSGNIQITKIFDTAMLNTLLPERKSPFDIVLRNEAQSAMVDHYVINVTFSNTNPLPMGLQILSNSSYIDELRSLHINGTLKNIGENAATNVRVVATCYDVAGKVVAAALNYLGLEDVLTPGQTVPFEIVLDAERAQYVYRYELTGESKEYAIVPEFRADIVLLHLMIAFAFVLVIRRRSSIHNKNPHRRAL